MINWIKFYQQIKQLLFKRFILNIPPVMHLYTILLMSFDRIFVWILQTTFSCILAFHHREKFYILRLNLMNFRQAYAVCGKIGDGLNSLRGNRRQWVLEKVFALILNLKICFRRVCLITKTTTTMYINNAIAFWNQSLWKPFASCWT